MRDLTDFLFDIINIKRLEIDEEQKYLKIKKLMVESDDNLQYAAMTLVTCILDDQRNLGKMVH